MICLPSELLIPTSQGVSGLLLLVSAELCLVTRSLDTKFSGCVEKGIPVSIFRDVDEDFYPSLGFTLIQHTLVEIILLLSSLGSSLVVGLVAGDSVLEGVHGD
jgi:hypothetical protein